MLNVKIYYNLKISTLAFWCCMYHCCLHNQLTFNVTCFRMDVSAEGSALAVRCPDLRWPLQCAGQHWFVCDAHTRTHALYWMWWMYSYMSKHPQHDRRAFWEISTKIGYKWNMPIIFNTCASVRHLMLMMLVFSLDCF